ncbi:hypothetical protein TELCIR_10683 [Teladorsagia circumcincta]|uniref:Uncharacterized protein n=1 Tax=Teladorsagia circumcincta TaxID=45464 RepID=A0A2G9UBD7_TELCI|nr:hypothetical protein TELCIR_10683 [Teladorsagia circumcincta]
MNEPLYVASGEGQVDGCNFDSDCEQYVPFAKCATSDPNKGLCYTTNDTNFIRRLIAPKVKLKMRSGLQLKKTKQNHQYYKK